MLFIVGITLAFFTSLVMLTKKNKSSADWILTVWLAIAGIHIFLFYMFVSGGAFHYPSLLGIERPLPLLHGPFLYLYAGTLTQRVKLKWSSLIHFAPALAAYFFIVPFILLPADQKIYVYRNSGQGYEAFNIVTLAAICISGVVYIASTAILLRRHRQRILEQFSNTDKITLRWLQYLSYGLSIIWLAVLTRAGDQYVFTAVVLFVVFVGYFGLTQANIGAVAPVDDEKDATDSKKYAKSGLTADSAKVLYENLMDEVTQKKLYRDGELTLVQLAERLKTHPNYVSQIINERTGKNFYDFINYLRVEEFIRLASDPANQKFTLLALASDCGFNSKSAFNRAVRKMTNKAPSEFLKDRR